MSEEKLSVIRNQQVQRLIELGCPTLRGMHDEEYRDFLPRILPNPVASRQYGYPLIVETLPIGDLIRLANIVVEDVDLQTVVDVHGSNKKKPYIAWTQIPYWKVEISEEALRRRRYGWQENDSRVANLRESVNYFLQFPKIGFSYDTTGMHILGTQTEDGRYLRISRPHRNNPPYYLFATDARQALRWGADVLMCYQKGKRIGPPDAQDGSKYGNYL